MESERKPQERTLVFFSNLLLEDRLTVEEYTKIAEIYAQLKGAHAQIEEVLVGAGIPKRAEGGFRVTCSYFSTFTAPNENEEPAAQTKVQRNLRAFAEKQALKTGRSVETILSLLNGASTVKVA